MQSPEFHAQTPFRILGRIALALALAILISVVFLADFSRPIHSVVGIGVLFVGWGVALAVLWHSFRKTQAQTRLYGQILDSMPLYALVLDRHYRILWTNKLFRRDFRMSAGEMCYAVFRGVNSPCPDCTAHQTFEIGDVHTREHTLTRKNGETLHLLVDSAPVIDDKGKTQAVLEIAVDVTSLKEMQKQFVLLGQAVAGMAHSIKNIMMGLDGGIYVVNRGLEADSQAEVEEGWQMVQLNFEKISALVKDILYCSKEREPDFQEVDPNGVLKQIYELYSDTARSYHIDLELHVDESAVSAVADPQGLHTVLANLVANAIDACKVDVWKDSHRIELKSHRGSDGSTLITISDNGVGMDQELKDRAFEDFFTSKGNQGTGLGLMVTQKIMREHGGTISFDSSPGQGTTFTVVFPPRDLPA